MTVIDTVTVVLKLGFPLSATVTKTVYEAVISRSNTLAVRTRPFVTVNSVEEDKSDFWWQKFLTCLKLKQNLLSLSYKKHNSKLVSLVV